MKAIFYIPDTADSELAGAFPGMHPALLPVLNRPLLEYMIQFAANQGVHDILIADGNYDASVAEFVGNGAKWSLHIDYIGVRELKSLAECKRRFAGFLDEEKTFIWCNALLFAYTDYCSGSENVTWTACEEAQVLEEPGVFRLVESGWELAQLESDVIKSVRTYFDCCMRVLEDERPYYPMPGFRVDNGILFGMNVSLLPSCQIVAPAVIGDNVSMEERVVLEGGVCINDDVVIDKRSTLKRTIVLDHTYIGADLEVIGKIVYRDRMIDPYSGAVLVPMDAALLADIRNYGIRKGIHRLVDILGALVILLLWAPLWGIFWLLGVRASSQGFFRNAVGKRCAFRKYELNLKRWKELYFYKFSLDKYGLLLHVLEGNLCLVGAALESLPALESIGLNEPGAFCFSDTRGDRSSSVQMLLDDRYYLYNRTLKLEFTTLLRALGGRLMATSGKGRHE